MEIKIDATKSAVVVITGAFALFIIYLFYDKIYRAKPVYSPSKLDAVIKSLEAISSMAIKESQEKKAREVNGKKIVPTKITVDQSKAEKPEEFPKIKKRKYRKKKK